MEQVENLLKYKTIDSESIYDLLYNLHFFIALAESEADIINGRVITLEELNEEMETRYEYYCNKKSS